MVKLQKNKLGILDMKNAEIIIICNVYWYFMIKLSKSSTWFSSIIVFESFISSLILKILSSSWNALTFNE